MNRLRLVISGSVLAWCCSCTSALVYRTDRGVHQLLEERQRSALGAASDANIGAESGDVPPSEEMYSFTPHPAEYAVPESFRAPPPASSSSAAAPGGTTGQPANGDREEEQTQSIYSPAQSGQVQVFNLKDAIAYAMRHARELQDAKEELYLAALDLTLERHLWTPQFVADVQSNYDDFPENIDTERSLITISDLAVRQRLPFGGDVTAQVVHTLTREVSDHVSKGESGLAILSANLPLLRGAGRSAYESRYAAEREMIYAVRRFEQFRRGFVVRVAADYFALQQAKASIGNTYRSYLNRRQDYARAEFIERVGRSLTIFDAPRAKANLRAAEAALVNDKERYASALDRFKVLLAMPMETLLEVVDQESDEHSRAVDSLLTAVDEATATRVALQYRLDLLNSVDQADDARRGVAVAKNRLLPDVGLTGSVTYNSDPEQLRPANLNEDRSTWHGGIRFRMDDRYAERNAYRAALIDFRATQRRQEELADVVRAEVRRALRRISQQDNLRRIQAANAQENELRVQAARAQFELGKIPNRDVVEAENNHLFAQNELAQAVAEYRIAILEFRRDTGTLRVADDGRWDLSDSVPADR